MGERKTVHYDKNIVLVLIELFVFAYCMLMFALCEKLDVLFLCRMSLIVSTIILLLLRIQQGSWINPTLLFYLSFCLFQMGQYYLYAVGAEYDYFFCNDYYSSLLRGESSITLSIKYSIICICMFSIGLSIKAKQRHKETDFDSTETCKDTEGLLITGRTLFFLSMPFTLLYAAAMLYVALLYGYEGLREGFGEGLLERLSMLSRITQFFAPSVILLRIYYRNTKKAIILNIVILSYALVFIVIGQRTVCLALFLIYLFMKTIDGKEHQVQKNNTVLIVAALLAIVFLSSYIANTRGKVNEGFAIQSVLSPIVFFIGECGWTGFIMPVISSICPAFVPYAYGKAYLAAATCFFPSFIDPTGTLKMLSNYCADQWVTDYLGFSWGVGYSLIGESYYNFSLFGVVAIFVLGVIISAFFNNYYLEDFDKQPLFRQYVMIVMLYEIITLPRRGIYYLFNALFYDVFVFYVGMKFFRKNALNG